MQQITIPQRRTVARVFTEIARKSYYRARYYDPQAGRFLSEDPIGFSGGGNFYEYGQNGPIDESDPDGLSPTGKDRWYGYNNDDFHKWFHRCWKQPGDPDADKGGIKEAYEVWNSIGRPKNGNCGGGEPNQKTQNNQNNQKKKDCGCNQKTNFEYQMDEDSNRYMQHLWEDILIGDFALAVVGTAGAAGLLGESCIGGAGGAGGAARPPAAPVPIRPPAPPVPKSAPPLPKAA